MAKISTAHRRRKAYMPDERGRFGGRRAARFLEGAKMALHFW